MKPNLVSISVAALTLIAAGFASDQAHSQPNAARLWQQRAKTAIAAMDEEILNERELAQGRLVTQMLKTGEVEAAVALAQSMSNSRINVLLKIGNQLVSAGKLDEARKIAIIVEMAIKEALTEKDNSVSMLGDNLRTLVGVYAGLGDFEQARQAMSHITPEMDRSGTHFTMRSVFRIPDGRLRAECLWDISLNQIKSGDLAAAKRTIVEIGSRPMREAAWWTAVDVIAETGNTAEALALAREIPPCDLAGKVYVFASPEGPEEVRVASFQANAFRSIAMQQAKSKDLQAARTTIRLIPLEDRPERIQALAMSLVKMSAYAQALTVASWHDDQELDQWVLSQTARQQADGGDLKAAISTASEITSKAARAMAFVAIADRQLKNGDVSAARQSVDKLGSAIPKTPISIRLQLLLESCRLLLGCGDQQGAKKSLVESATLADAERDVDEQQNYWMVTAIGYGMAGDLENADAASAKLKLPGRAAHAWVEIAKYQATQGQRDAALISLQKALQKSKSIDFEMPLDWLPSKPRNLRNIGGAMIALNMASELEAMIATEKSKFVRAYLCLGAAESYSPDNIGLAPATQPAGGSQKPAAREAAEQHTSHGVAARERSDVKFALEQLNEAIRLDPTYAPAFAERAFLFRRQQKRPEAWADCTEALRLDPVNATALEVRAALRGLQGEWDAAIEDFDTLVLLAPDNRAFLGRAYAWYNKGEWGKTIQDLDELIRLSPFPWAFDFRASIWHKVGNFDKAVADYSEAIRLDPKFAVAYYGRGDVRSDKGELDQAIADYDEAIRHNPKFAEAYHHRGKAHQKKGDLDLAIHDYNEVINLDPKFAAAYYDRGNVWLGKVELKNALQDYSEAIRIKPDVALAYDRRAWLLATAFDDRLRDGNQAVDDATTACQMTNWKDHTMLLTLAAAYAETGNFAKAVEWQTKAMEMAAVKSGDEHRSQLDLYRSGKPYRAPPVKRGQLR